MPRRKGRARVKQMEVHLKPELQKKLDRLATLSGRSAEAETREMLDSRYDDIKSGKVKLSAGEEVEAYFREKSAAARRPQTGSCFDKP
jgi:plasmid stability protein